MTTADIACIVADWGTSNRRAWALTATGAVIAEHHDDQGLLALADRRFADSFRRFCGDWLTSDRQVPIVMAGMVGSKMGWQEVPYQFAPIPLRDLSRHLTRLTDPLMDNAWIVPGIALDDAVQPEVMRGEECQALGALLDSNQQDGVFVLPGTHAKWALVEQGRLTSFRTYMTGEIFGLLRKSGTLSQLMAGDVMDDDTFDKGVMQSQRADASNLLHSLFSVRTLGLFDRLPRESLSSYMSGLLVGAEVRDATAWLSRLGISAGMTTIGSPLLLRAYERAAKLLHLDMTCRDSAGLLPVALLSLAQEAGLLSSS